MYLAVWYLSGDDLDRNDSLTELGCASFFPFPMLHQALYLPLSITAAPPSSVMHTAVSHTLDLAMFSYSTEDNMSKLACSTIWVTKLWTIEKLTSKAKPDW